MIDFTPEQQKLIKDSFLAGASDQDAKVLIEVAKAKGLNPMLNQIFFVSRWDSSKKPPRYVWSFQVSIDGLRAIAERSGEYQGQGEPVFEYEADGTLRSCKVAVYRKGWERPCVGVAFYKEYVQYRTDPGADGKPVPMALWKTKPHVMLAKCAEAQALRKAFPLETGGLYAEDEMSMVLPVVEEPKALPATVSEPTTKLLQSVNASNTLAELDALIPDIKGAQISEGERAVIRKDFIAKKLALGEPK